MPAISWWSALSEARGEKAAGGKRKRSDGAPGDVIGGEVD